jgi:hypothetical protein
MKRTIKNPQRRTEANTERTQKLVETFKGKCDLLSTWEATSDDVQADNHDDILKLRAKVRTLRNRISHRSYDVEV